MRTLSILGLAGLALVAHDASAQAADPIVNERPLSEWIAELKAPAPLTRNAAAYTIGGLGPAATPAVPALIEALNDPVDAVRYPVCVALREIGPGAIAAVPALTEMLDDRNDDIASMARKAIKSITG
ncbi:MAG: HEAT repeat domain-containing protein, partial [Gemmatimonadota bacterium]|nr:HEAT repeat domain-containing protein [Gemmatimonadota bacterium]